MRTRPIVALLLAAASLSAQTPSARPLVLDNIRIIDGTGAPAIERGRIVIEGSRIVSSGPAATVEAPANAERIDLGGRTVLPGLIDLHFHIENDPKLALRQLGNGVTSFRDPGQWEEKFTGLRRMIADDRLPGPRIFTTGPHIDGENPAYPADSVVARDAEEARQFAERAVRQGANAIKIYYRLPFASAQAVIDVCNARRIPCTAHLELLNAADLIEAGLHGIEHITSFGVSLLPELRAETYRQSVLKDNDARRDGRYALFAALDLDGPEAKAVYTVIGRRRPFIDPTLAVFERRADRPPKGTKPDTVPILADGFRKMQAFTRRAAQAGARIVVGGHTDVPFAARGEAPWREMELLAESGFSPLEVIAAATGTAAAFLYQDDRIGTLRSGLDADLIVLRDDPRQDIAAIRSVERVMASGRWVERERYRSY
jgi:imidazolonepropionase-like amidohydrolase